MALSDGARRMVQETVLGFEDRLLTRSEVQERFGFPTKRFLEVSAGRDDGPAEIRFGRLVRYRVRDIQSWIEQHR